MKGQKNSVFAIFQKPPEDVFKWLTVFNTIAIIFLSIFIAFSYFSGRNGNGRPSDDSDSAGRKIDMKPVVDGARYTGADKPKVSIVVFNSFTCGFCRKASPVLNRVLQKYPDKVRLVYRHFIRNEMDIVAANAVECAGEQNKFWQMHDQIFEDNSNEFNFNRYAQNLSMDVSQFKKCLTENKFTNKIRNDSEMGQQLGIQGTPTFIINGNLVVGYRPFEVFDAMVKEAL